MTRSRPQLPIHFALHRRIRWKTLQAVNCDSGRIAMETSKITRPNATLTSKEQIERGFLKRVRPQRLGASRAILLMRTAKLRRRRSIYSDLVDRAWLTLETSADLIEERRAQIKKLARHLQPSYEREFSRRRSGAEPVAHKFP